MGIFNKDKQNSAPSAPPAPGMPPAPNAAPPAPPGVPPAPNAAPPGIAPPPAMNNEGQNNSEIESNPGLLAPPLPGTNLDDIKTQVASPIESTTPPSNQLPEKLPTPEGQDNSEETHQQESHDDELDSLFDISDLELPDSPETPSDVALIEEKTTKEDVSVQNNEEPTTANNEKHEKKMNQEETPNEKVEFISHHKEVNEVNPFFVKTSQFKALLEIIEGVKQKTKESSERHLRLLDIKSEEDIEYENLKKDFAFIEDKLYEVDTLIFENE